MTGPTWPPPGPAWDRYRALMAQVPELDRAYAEGRATVAAIRAQERALDRALRAGGRTVDLHPNHAVGLALGLKHATRHGRRQDALVVGGCGMDMGFHLVHNLGYVLYPDGFECTGDHCPSNDHSNGDRDYSPHRHESGGYALRHRWL